MIPRLFGVTAVILLSWSTTSAQEIPWVEQAGEPVTFQQALPAPLSGKIRAVRSMDISGRTAMVDMDGVIHFYEEAPNGNWVLKTREAIAADPHINPRQLDIAGDVAIANSRFTGVHIWRYSPSGWIEEPVVQGGSPTAVAIEGDIAVLGYRSVSPDGLGEFKVFRFNPELRQWRPEITRHIDHSRSVNSVAISDGAIVVAGRYTHVYRGAPLWHKTDLLYSCPSSDEPCSTIDADISGPVITTANTHEFFAIYEENAGGFWDFTGISGFGTQVAVAGDVLMVGKPLPNGNAAPEGFGTVDFFQRGEAEWVWRQQLRERLKFPHWTDFGRFFALDNGRALIKTVQSSGGTLAEIAAVANVSFQQPNQPPELSVPDLVTGKPGETVGFHASGTDLEDDPFEIRAYGLPAGATFTGTHDVMTFTWNQPPDPTATIKLVGWQTSPPFMRSEVRTVVIAPPPPEMAPTTPTLVFGNAALGGSASRTFDVTNTGDYTPLVVSQIESTDPGVFAANPDNFSLDPGQTQTVTLTFTPSGGGSFGGSLSIYSNADDSPRSVAISARAGFPAFVEVPPAALPALVDEPLSFQVTAQRAGTLEPLPVTVDPLPDGASLLDGEFAWTPTAADVGTYVLDFETSDPQSGLSASHRVTLTVTRLLVEDGKLELAQFLGVSFGQTLAADHQVAIIGSPEGNSSQYEGSAYAFRRIDGAWTQEHHFLPPWGGGGFQGQHGRFGYDVAVSGNRAIIGAPGRVTFHTLKGKAYIYRYSNGAWTQETLLQSDAQETQDNFGTAVDIDGDLAVVSTDHLNGGAEEVHVYRRGAGGWAREAVLQAPAGQIDVGYGTAVAVEGDLIAVGASRRLINDRGAVYIYRFDGSSWSAEATIEAGFQYPDILGFRLGAAVDIDGGRIAVGEQLRAHLLHYEAGSWQSVKIADQIGTGVHPSFGESVSISGETIAVGASDARMDDGTGTWIDGAVFLYLEEESGDWTSTLVQKSEGGRINDEFGHQVAVTGGRLLVADNRDGGGYGAVHAFQLPFTSVAPPVITGPGTQVVTEGELLQFDVTATDPDAGQTVTVAATALPPGASFDGTTLTWTPTLDQAGSHDAVFVATDDGTPPQSSAPLSVLIAVNDVVPIGEQVESTPVDPETGQTPVTLAFDTVTGSGETTVEINPTGPPQPSSFRLGNPPVFYDLETTADFEGVIEVQFSYAGQSFPDEAALRLFHFENGAWVDITTALDTEAQVITGETTTLSPFAVFQSDNQLPVLDAVADQTVDEGQVLVVKIGATDPDGGSPALRVEDLPSFAISFDRGDGTGAIIFAPGSADKGTYESTVTASDGIDEDRVTFSLEVIDVNAAPRFVAGDEVTVSEDAGAQEVVGWATNISPGAPDESGQALQFTVAGGGALFVEQPAIDPSGTLTFTAAANAHGTAALSVRLSDDAGTDNGGVDTSEEITLTIAVEPANDPPVAAAGADATVECAGAATSVQLDGSASDDIDGDVLTLTWTDAAGTVVAEGATPVAELPLGQHALTLTVTDPSGSAHSDEVVVTIEDTTPPTIALQGDNPIVLECPAAYVEPGAVASDVCDPAPLLVIDASAVQPNTPGDYAVTYIATDASGNQTVATRTVRMVDTTPPVLSLLGDAEVTVECGFTYHDAGASALDACDGNLTAKIAVSSSVDASVPGTYSVTYDVSDAAGNAAARITRTVHVVDTTPPALTLEGDDPIRVELGTTYIDPGAEAVDLCDGDLSDRIAITSTVDIQGEGAYAVTYAVADAAGNPATLTRAVEVVVTPNSYVLVATNSMQLKERAKVHSGFVGVVDRGTGPFLANKVELSIGSRALLEEGVRASGPRVRVKNRATVAGTLVYDEIKQAKKVTIGQEITPGSWPLFDGFGLPPFVDGTPGAVDVKVKKKKMATLSPQDGPFREIKVKERGTLILTGGEYHIDELEVGSKAAVLIQAPTTLVISGHFALGQRAYFGPENPAVDPADIRVYVAGENGRDRKKKSAKSDKSAKSGKDDDDDGGGKGSLRAGPVAVKVGVKAIFAGNVQAPNGTVYLKEQSQSTGSLIGRDLILGNKAQVQLRSGWRTEGVLYEAPAPVAKVAYVPPDDEGALFVDNYPNPFNPATTIRYMLPELGAVQLAVYNALGQEVAVLVDQTQPAGVHHAEWDGTEQGGRPAASGFYFYRLQGSGRVVTGRMLLMK